jgi:uncharacterized ion transporter superfamily protein YfcC
MKNKSVLKAMGIILGITFLLTWIIPSTTITSSGLTLGSIAGTGFADIFSTIEILLIYFAKPAVFILFVGMFYLVASKTGTFKALVKNIARIFKKDSYIFLIATVLFYAVTTAMTGIYIPMFMFIPLSIAVLKELKYNKLESVLATAGASTIGLIGELSNSIIKSMIGSEENSFIWIKLGLLVLLVVFTIVYLLFIKNKDVKSTKDENISVELLDVKKQTKGISLFVVIILLFVVFVLGLTPWNTNFTTAFDNAYTAIKSVKIGNFAIISAILGVFETFGSWTYTSLYPTIALAIIVLAVANKLSVKDTFEACVEGAKRVSGLAVVALLLNIVTIFALNSGFVGTLINLIAKSGNIALVTLSTIVAVPFFTDMSYVVQYVLSILNYAIGNEDMLTTYGYILQVINGLVLLIAPSSVLLMVTLGYTEEKYSSWAKYIWKLLLAVFVIVLISIVLVMVL